MELDVFSQGGPGESGGYMLSRIGRVGRPELPAELVFLAMGFVVAERADLLDKRVSRSRRALM